MPKLSPEKPRVLIRYLKSKGFAKIRQKGSHAFFARKDGRTTVVPIHKGREIRPGLVRKILKDVGISPSKYIKEKK